LIALRERQPAPMAVLVLRIEGFESVSARFGREAANVLRRKLAVRLRAGVRASDVVASLGDDSYAVLLAALLAPGAAAHVGAKLLTVLRAPFHHALTFRGIAEPKAVVRLWIVSLLLAAIALLSLKVR
ncbi:MAG TPA: diguanylate cyclase, partial [Thermoanaerobaculia bacterium]|nr:diguanylate cyclase [Thermoanaerobaculia bacterium]